MADCRSAAIVVADDDADDCLLLKEALKECSLDVNIDSVSDGEELMDYLIDRIGDGLPDLIIMDLYMPRKNGFEALEEIKSNAHLKQIPVIVFTGSTFDGDLNRCYEMGANTVVRKPSEFEKLAEVTKSIYAYWFRTARG